MFQPTASIRKETHLHSTSRYDLLPLSPKHEQVQNSKKIIRINQTIKSIMSIGKMQKMNLIAINNRCLFNYGKVKRAELTNRKKSYQNGLFLPDLKKLKLDNRAISRKNAQMLEQAEFELIQDHKVLGKQMKTSHVDIESELCQKLIEQYMQRLKTERKLSDIKNREELILEACKEIQVKMEKEREGKSAEKKESKMVTEGIKLVDKNEQMHRKFRSITEATYNEDLLRIDKSSQYSAKRRFEEEKMFLRRIKCLKRQSIPV